MKVAAILAAVLATTASARPLAMKYKRDVLNALDFQIVNLALNLENLELNLWAQGLQNFTEQNFTDAGVAPGFRTYLELLRDQEIAHVALLEQVLATPFTNCTYTFPVYNPRDLISFGQIVTSVGEGAYLGALANITSPSVRQSAGQIIGNEARQNSLLRTYERLNFFNALNFDTPITGAQAFSLASQYWTCPVGNNPPFNFTQIPPLNLTFANPNATQDHKAGDLVTATWNATQAFLGADVFVRVLSDVNDIQVPLNQTTITRNGTGRGTFTLPAGINGTAFVVATIYNASGPIPDAFNYAIGPLLVA